MKEGAFMEEKLPKNLEEALEYIRKQQIEIDELKATVDKQIIMLSNLNEMLVKGRKAIFGKSSEQICYIDGSEQLLLFNEAEQEYSASNAEPTVETITVKSQLFYALRCREALLWTVFSFLGVT